MKEKAISTFSGNSAKVRAFLNLPYDGEIYLIVEPHELNPLLRTIEMFEDESCIVEMMTLNELKARKYNSIKPHYKVYRKIPLLTEWSNSDKEYIPGVRMVKNFFYCGQYIENN